MSVYRSDGTMQQVKSDEKWSCSQNAGEGWMETGFDDSRWTPATVVGDYGALPWGALSENLDKGTPEWAGASFRDQSWKPAVSLGVPPVKPWLDVPTEMLAGAQRPLGSWLDWKLDRFSGYVDYSTTFTLGSGRPGRLSLDLGRVTHMAEVWVNDKKVGERLWAPFEFDVTSAVHPGKNKIRVRVGNLVTNEMAQFADKGRLNLWGWGAAPARKAFDAGLFGPVRILRSTPPALQPK
jgi:hypothetical protein